MIEILQQMTTKIVIAYREMEEKLKIQAMSIEKLKKEKKEMCKVKQVSIREQVYLNLHDVCRVSKDLFHFDEDKIKQYMFQEGLLIKRGNKYIPNSKNKVVCELINEELYISERYFRGVLIFLRNCVYLDKDLTYLMNKYKKHKNEHREKISNTVSVEYKQNSQEFQECKTNKFCRIK